MTPHPLPCGTFAQRAFGIGGCTTCDGDGSALVLGVRLPCHCRPHIPTSATSGHIEGMRP
jgi:hypothetical protein